MPAEVLVAVPPDAPRSRWITGSLGVVRKQGPVIGLAWPRPQCGHHCGVNFLAARRRNRFFDDAARQFMALLPTPASPATSTMRPLPVATSASSDSS
jgi:hypothetical protein